MAELFAGAGLRDVEAGRLVVRVEHATFEDRWEPFTLGVGPAGAYAAHLGTRHRARLRDLCRERLPEPPFAQSAVAWAARGFA
jgi:hypothetical protein